MRMLLAACLLAIPVSAQNATSPAHGLTTFTSPDGTFRLRYSDVLVRCEARPQKTGQGFSWAQKDCVSYIPVCGPADANQPPALCLAYPHNQHTRSDTFGAAAFSVWETTQSEKDCLADADQALPTVTIHGVKFKGGESTDAAMSHYRDAKVFSAFHNGKCYSLGITTGMTNAAAFDPPAKELSKEDMADINGQLEQARDSFEFLK